MICRPIHASFGNRNPPLAWELVTQPDHARLAGSLARRWQLEPQGHCWDATRRTQLYAAIDAHDEGWQTVDEHPVWLADEDRPKSFLDSSTAEKDRIWSESIEQAVSLGPLAQSAIAGHFLRFRRLSLKANAQSADAFVARYAPRVDQWTSGLGRELAETAIGTLSFFDAVSLWLCMAHEDRGEIECGGRFYEVAYHAGQQAWSVHPWPFSEEFEVFSIPYRRLRLPAGRSEDLPSAWKSAEEETRTIFLRRSHAELSPFDA